MPRSLIARSSVTLALVGASLALPTAAGATPKPAPSAPGVTVKAPVVPPISVPTSTASDLVTLLTGGSAKVVTDATGTVSTMVSSVPVVSPVASALATTVRKAAAPVTSPVTAPVAPAAPSVVTKTVTGATTTTPAPTAQPGTVVAQDRAQSAAISNGRPAVAGADDPMPPNLFDLLAREQVTTPTVTTPAPVATSSAPNLALTGLGVGVPILAVGAVVAGALARRRVTQA